MLKLQFLIYNIFLKYNALIIWKWIFTDLVLNLLDDSECLVEMIDSLIREEKHFMPF